jgi:hypothetical protein
MLSVRISAKKLRNCFIIFLPLSRAHRGKQKDRENLHSPFLPRGTQKYPRGTAAQGGRLPASRLIRRHTGLLYAAATEGRQRTRLMQVFWLVDQRLLPPFPDSPIQWAQQ